MGKIKMYIKCISFLLVIMMLFMFSYVLATDDSIYVWSSDNEPKAETTSARALTTNVDTVTENTLQLESGGAILIEQHSGQILYEHNSHEKLRPASVTKVMSILLIMEAIDSRTNIFNR